jgi:Ca-activated chloride channel family protein
MNIDDPRLTAYALGELSDEERAALEKELSGDEEAREFVNATRAFTTELRTALRAEETPGLTPDQREKILGNRSHSNVIEARSRFVAYWITGIAAAVVLTGVLGVVVVRPAQQKATGVAAVNPVEPTMENVPVQVALTPAPVAQASASPQTSTLLAMVQPTPAPLLIEKTQPEVHRWREELKDKLDAATAPIPAEEGPVFGVRAGKSTTAVASMTRQAQGALRESSERADFYEKRAAIAQTQEAVLVPGGGFNTAAFDSLPENPFLAVKENPLSTFSIDVDTASYSIVRRMLHEGNLPPKGAVRIEELLNYFKYDYPEPREGEPFSVNLDSANCPWAPGHRLVRVGLKGRAIPTERMASNLVFLVDVSGSMSPDDRLPLLKRSLRLLVEQLGTEDRVAIVVYAGQSGLALPSTPGSRRDEILGALENLRSGGSTNGASGIRLAYEVAAQNFIKGGVNRVILATDGDFNVGVTSQSALIDLIEEKAKSGVFLSVLGFGMDNLKDSMMEKLADKGNGNYSYIDSINEGRKVLIEQMHGTLVTIAKDVKIQVEWNPARVSSYRLLGYENRMLRKEDFNDDTKDAGEIGAGHTVTALYEVVPAGAPDGMAPVDPLKYQPAVEGKTAVATPASAEMLTIKLRYKEPDGQTSRLMEKPFTDTGATIAQSSGDLRWAAGVAGFGMLLRESQFKGDLSWEMVRSLTGTEVVGDQTRAEFQQLVRRAEELSRAARE